MSIKLDREPLVKQARRFYAWMILMVWLTWMPGGVLSAAEADTKPPAVGEKAVDFDLPIVGQDGYIELKNEYAKGPVVVVVLRGYPGYQCPLCSQQFGSLINRAQALAKETHRVIMVYPGQPTKLERHAEQFIGSRAVREPLVLVRDPAMQMVESWGLRWDCAARIGIPGYIRDQQKRSCRLVESQ